MMTHDDSWPRHVGWFYVSDFDFLDKNWNGWYEIIFNVNTYIIYIYVFLVSRQCFVTNLFIPSPLSVSPFDSGFLSVVSPVAMQNLTINGRAKPVHPFMENLMAIPPPNVTQPPRNKTLKRSLNHGTMVVITVIIMPLLRKKCPFSWKLKAKARPVKKKKQSNDVHANYIFRSTPPKMGAMIILDFLFFVVLFFFGCSSVFLDFLCVSFPRKLTNVP